MFWSVLLVEIILVFCGLSFYIAYLTETLTILISEDRWLYRDTPIYRLHKYGRSMGLFEGQQIHKLPHEVEQLIIGKFKVPKYEPVRKLQYPFNDPKLLSKRLSYPYVLPKRVDYP